MTAMTIDTYRFADLLQKNGFTKQQAEGLLEAVRVADLDKIVTNETLDTRLREMELRLKLHLGGMIVGLGGVLIAIKYIG